MPKLCFRRIESSCRGSVGDSESATHNATDNRSGLHVLRRTYAAVRDLQMARRTKELSRAPTSGAFLFLLTPASCGRRIRSNRLSEEQFSPPGVHTP
jgi:hypothetical protein